MSNCLLCHVCSCGIAWLLLDEFSWNYIFGGFTKICPENLSLLETGQRNTLHVHLHTYITTLVTIVTMIAFVTKDTSACIGFFFAGQPVVMMIYKANNNSQSG
jgi:hypothetical protein